MSTLLNNIDYNSRLAPSMEPKVPNHPPQKYNLERITIAILPLLAMNRSVSFGLQIFAGGSNVFNAFSKVEDSGEFKDFANLTLQVASFGLLYFNPVAVSILEHTKGIYDGIIKCKHNIADNQYKNAFYDGVNIAGKCVYIGSVVTGGPNLILISMVAQGAFELYKTKEFYNKGMHLEAVVEAVIAVSRGGEICRHVKTHHSDLIDSFEKFKTNFSKSGTVADSSRKSKVYHAYSISVEWLYGSLCHVASYENGTTVYTFLTGISEGVQGFKMNPNDEYLIFANVMKENKKYIVHCYNDRKIYSNEYGQYIKMN